MGVSLSRREIECLQWTAAGKKCPEIAIILGIAPSTVQGYIKSIMTKLDVVTKPQAVSKAIGLGMIVGGWNGKGISRSVYPRATWNYRGRDH